jgi:hypothetical protein
MLAIDPGSTESGFVVFCNSTNKVISYGKIKNKEILSLSKDNIYDLVLIEKPDFLSIGAGATVIDTIFWAGRFNQAFKGSITFGRSYMKKSYKLKNDSAVIQFIKDKYPGIKLTKDSWQAFLLIHSFEDGLINLEKKKNKNKKVKIKSINVDLFE